MLVLSLILRILMASSSYTDPQLREKLKKQILYGQSYGKPGRWNARKSQILAKRYKQAGGGYKEKRTVAAKSLDRWTKQKWRTRDGNKAIRDGYTARYLPDSAWKKLTPNQARATDKKKILASRRGENIVANTKRARAIFPR